MIKFALCSVGAILAVAFHDVALLFAGVGVFYLATEIVDMWTGEQP